MQMTETLYADIAASCDRLLRAPGTSLARLAIPALHCLNEHPSTLAQYETLGCEGEGARSAAPKTLLRALRGMARAFAAPPPRGLPEGIDALIVSHLMRPDQLNEPDDFYFGALQSLLHTHGVSSLLIWVDHRSPARAAGESPSPPFPRLILPTVVTPAAERRIWRQCRSASRALLEEAAATANPVEKALSTLTSRQALSASTVVNLRMHTALAEICRTLNPKLVITTYEGTVAERLIWHAARTAQHRPLCVGYQHALVLQRAHAIFRPVEAKGIDCDPDVILTLGESPHARLAASAALHKARLIEYGSHRRAKTPKLPDLEQRPRRCLVLPDAHFQECVTLFDFALDCAHRAPEVSFRLRPHPMVHIPSLERRLPRLRHAPPNVSLSGNLPLAQELAQARYCLYRGSSAALHAVAAGLKPFYFKRPGELPFDCLFELEGWRETVESVEDCVNGMRHADHSGTCSAAVQAAAFCERYVSPLKTEAIKELLAMVKP